MDRVKELITKIIFSVIAVISVILVVRFLIDQIQISGDNGLINVLVSITNPFVAPFIDILPSSYNFPIRMDAAMAALVYIIWGILLAIFLTAFFQESKKEIFKDSTDPIFKFFESVLLFRILSDFVGMNELNPFIQAINSLSSFSDGVIRREMFDGRFNVSAIVVLIIILIFDLLMERVIDYLFTEKKEE